MVETLPDFMEEGTQNILKYEQALKRKGQPIEIAKVLAFLLSDESSFTTGAVYVYDGSQVY